MLKHLNFYEHLKPNNIPMSCSNVLSWLYFTLAPDLPKPRTEKNSQNEEGRSSFEDKNISIPRVILIVIAIVGGVVLVAIGLGFGYLISNQKGCSYSGKHYNHLLSTVMTGYGMARVRSKCYESSEIFYYKLNKKQL